MEKNTFSFFPTTSPFCISLPTTPIICCDEMQEKKRKQDKISDFFSISN